MPIDDLKEQIARLPEQPGVYLYANAAGDTIYVGKARALRDRVRSYLGAYGTSPKTDALLDEIARVDVIVTDSVVEALALENNLIKQRSPKFNILLRDDKNYPYLQLTTTEAFPRVLVARQVERDGNFYAGPFLPAKLARRTMSLTHRLFGMRSCNEVITGHRPRPCLEYDIKRCLAPCVETICTAERYQTAAADTRLFLEGRTQELSEQLEERMMAAAAEQRYEEAAQLRDAMRTVQAVRDRQQKMATSTLGGDRDVFGIHIGAEGVAVVVFLLRNGRVVERLELVADRIGDSADEMVQAIVEQFYADQTPASQVHLPTPPADVELLETWLSMRAERRVRVLVPQRGDKRGLVELAQRNAGLVYRSRFNARDTAHLDALETLQQVLALSALPRRIECFDISTLQGRETVASMVVCEDGRMKRSDYRKFRVQGGPPFLDDFASMKQVVERRYRRVLDQGGPFPDLIVIDGGKGQLNAAYDALESVGLANLVAVGLAKKEELVFTRDREEPIAFDRHGGALRLLQRIRDEAHRFAVNFHRQARTMRDLRSDLDAVPGIGPRRRKTLLTTFGSLAGVRRATREELTSAIGAKAADQVLAYFAAH